MNVEEDNKYMNSVLNMHFVKITRDSIKYIVINSLKSNDYPESLNVELNRKINSLKKDSQINKDINMFNNFSYFIDKLPIIFINYVFLLKKNYSLKEIFIFLKEKIHIEINENDVNDINKYYKENSKYQESEIYLEKILLSIYEMIYSENCNNNNNQNASLRFLNIPEFFNLMKHINLFIIQIFKNKLKQKEFDLKPSIVLDKINAYFMFYSSFSIQKLDKISSNSKFLSSFKISVPILSLNFDYIDEMISINLKDFKDLNDLQQNGINSMNEKDQKKYKNNFFSKFNLDSIMNFYLYSIQKNDMGNDYKSTSSNSNFIICNSDHSNLLKKEKTVLNHDKHQQTFISKCIVEKQSNGRIDLIHIDEIHDEKYEFDKDKNNNLILCTLFIYYIHSLERSVNVIDFKETNISLIESFKSQNLFFSSYEFLKHIPIKRLFDNYILKTIKKEIYNLEFLLNDINYHHYYGISRNLIFVDKGNSQDQNYHLTLNNSNFNEIETKRCIIKSLYKICLNIDLHNLNLISDNLEISDELKSEISWFNKMMFNSYTLINFDVVYFFIGKMNFLNKSKNAILKENELIDEFNNFTLFYEELFFKSTIYNANCLIINLAKKLKILKNKSRNEDNDQNREFIKNIDHLIFIFLESIFNVIRNMESIIKKSNILDEYKILNKCVYDYKLMGFLLLIHIQYLITSDSNLTNELKFSREYITYSVNLIISNQSDLVIYFLNSFHSFDLYSLYMDNFDFKSQLITYKDKFDILKETLFRNYKVTKNVLNSIESLLKTEFIEGLLILIDLVILNPYENWYELTLNIIKNINEEILIDILFTKNKLEKVKVKNIQKNRKLFTEKTIIDKDGEELFIYELKRLLNYIVKFSNQFSNIETFNTLSNFEKIIEKSVIDFKIKQEMYFTQYSFSYKEKNKYREYYEISDLNYSKIQSIIIKYKDYCNQYRNRLFEEEKRIEIYGNLKKLA